MADCDCFGGMFSHDSDCARELANLRVAGYEVTKIDGGSVSPMATEVGLTHRQLNDLKLRLNTAKADLMEMYSLCSPFSEGHARLQGKAQGIGLALSYLEEIPRCP